MCPVQLQLRPDVAHAVVVDRPVRVVQAPSVQADGMLDLTRLLQCLRDVGRLCKIAGIEHLELAADDFRPLAPDILEAVAAQVMPSVQVRISTTAPTPSRPEERLPRQEGTGDRTDSCHPPV